MRATFPPEYPLALPTHLFYDDNCAQMPHMQNNRDQYGYILDHAALPVDVFHFKSTHAETHLFCQTHCNPANFPELIDDDNQWVFNSSAAEQVNVWFGGFLAIVREMTVEVYNFYLDEMIAIQNRYVVEELQRKGHKPHLVPLDVLAGSS